MENNKIAIFGESGSFITTKLLQHIFCKLKTATQYEFCIKNFDKENIAIQSFDEQNISSLELLHYKNIIVFDLEYSQIDIKKISKMISLQDEDDYLILNVDNKEVKEFYNQLKDDSSFDTRIIPISVKKIQNGGASFIGNEIFFENEEYLTREFNNLTGEQNKINILAVFVFFILNNINPQEILENFYNFSELDNVFETLLHKDNITFINDIQNKNKSQSLQAFENIYWILCINDIKYEFNEFAELQKNFKNLKYVFIYGEYDDELLNIFKENDIIFFIMYSMNNIFNKINELLDNEKTEEKINVVLSSFNDLENNEFYNNCSKEFEKIVGKENE